MAKKTKKEELDEAVAKAVGAGREMHLETVDFSDPNRPKTCLEVDFPILPINTIAEIEGKGSGALKPIYQTMKWWARRRSTVFRQLLLSAATKAPEEVTESARLSWSSYYGNHQQNHAFHKLKVADIFMGGGTTIVEGARLGMQMFGNDLNPVAWFVVKNELAQVDPDEVKRLFGYVESEIKPQIMPFVACDCPRGHKGTWKKTNGEGLGKDFDPLALRPEQRREYKYEGPEVTYTFWAKHGPCQATECDHRTPIMTSPVVAVKSVSVKAWIGRECNECKTLFDVERHDARMAPGELFVVAPDEAPYTIMDDKGHYACPHCERIFLDEAAALNGKSSGLGKLASKNVALTLLVHPEWLKGCPGCDSVGQLLGGSVTDSAEATRAWNVERAKALRLIEVRGPLPNEIKCPDTGEVFFTDGKGGTMPRKAAFTCHQQTCGKEQSVYDSLGKYGKTGPVSMYAAQGICKLCEQAGIPLGGRFFFAPIDTRPFDLANDDWHRQKETVLADYWPRSAIPHGVTTHIDRPLGEHGFTHWWMMFNSRQLLVHSLLLKSIANAHEFAWEVREVLLGAFQQYLRNQNMFCFWNTQRALEPLFSQNNYAPKITVIENSVFSGVGRGDFHSCTEKAIEALQWNKDPWEIASNHDGLHSHKVKTLDPLNGNATLTCRSASDIPCLPDESIDLVITDPPFGGLLHYSELSDFFYTWLRLVLKGMYPDIFSAEYTPKTLEAVANKARNPEDHDAFYQKILTECWREARRVLKVTGLLAFTFHHSEDEPWVAVLESLFDAGFILEATFPIRSDETKGEGEFGSQTIEFDIVHVCRKRTEQPSEVSWARLRRQIMQDVGQLRGILEQHHTAGLQEADLQVIRRGKALEYYSKHYGKVYVEKGRPFSVREALVGINTLLDDERDTNKETPPVNAEPYTRQFLRLFTDKTAIPRDQMQKFLRGTGVSPSEFTERGWCSETQKVFHVTPPLELAREWKGAVRSGMARDFDQSMFLIGACYPNSGIRVQDTLDSPNFKPHPATPGILDWLTRHGGDSEIKTAARLAKQLYERWMAANESKVTVQRTLFDELED